MVKGKAEFSKAELDFLVKSVLESDLMKINNNARSEDANARRAIAWSKIRDAFTINFCPLKSKRTVEVPALMAKWRRVSGTAKGKYAEIKRVRDVTGGGFDPDLDDSLQLTDAEERIIAALGNTAAFNGITEGEETGIGNHNAEELNSRRVRKDHPELFETGNSSALQHEENTVEVGIENEGSASNQSQTRPDLNTAESSDSSRVRRVLSAVIVKKTKKASKRPRNPEEDFDAMFFENATPKSAKRDLDTINVLQDIREELRLGREQRKQEVSLLQQIASSLNRIESQSAGSGSSSSFTSPYKFNSAHYTHTPTSYSPSHSPSPFFPSTSNAFNPPSTFDHYETLSEDPNLVKSYYGDE